MTFTIQDIGIFSLVTFMFTYSFHGKASASGYTSIEHSLTAMTNSSKTWPKIVFRINSSLPEYF